MFRDMILSKNIDGTIIDSPAMEIKYIIVFFIFFLSKREYKNIIIITNSIKV